MKDEAIVATVDVVGASVGGKTLAVGTGTTAISWWMSNEAGVLIGILIGAIGLLSSLFFQIRRDRREQREHEAKMSSLVKKGEHDGQ